LGLAARIFGEFLEEGNNQSSKNKKKGKMMKKKIAVLALGMISVFVAGQEAGAVMASGLTASAQLDWSTFQIQSFVLPGFGAAPSWDISNQYEGSSSNVSGNTNGSGWSNGTSSQASGSSAVGTLSDAEVRADAMLDRAGSANSSAYRSAILEIDGSGLLVVSVDYKWEVSLVEGQSGNQSANAWCNISLQNAGDGVSANSSANGSLPSWNNLPVYLPSSNNLPVFYDDDAGTLVVAMLVTDGMMVNFNASTYANVSASAWISPDDAEHVPVPPALLLLGSGVIGLLAARRKVQA
jgi:hypothetical protein